MYKKLLCMAIVLAFVAFIMSCDKSNKTTSSEIDNDLLKSVMKDLSNFKIAFGDTENIYMMNADGTNVELLADAGPVSGYVSWSPDAKYVYYVSAEGPAETAWEAWRVNITTKEKTKISNFGLDVRSLGVSPDNRTMAISVMTGNSNIGNNNDNLTQFSTNLYTIAMSVVEAKIASGTQIILKDLTAIKSSPNKEQFWYEELSWNYDASNPTLAYTKTWRYDEDEVSYTHAYIIKPDGSGDNLIAENKDMPIWNFENDKLSFLDLSYYDFSSNSLKQINVTGISDEVSGGTLSPNGGKYILFEIGDENRKGGIAKTTDPSNPGILLDTKVDVYEPRWSPVPIK